MMGYCMICRNDKEETRHISLYVIGSEGLDICHECEMRIVEFARELMGEELNKKLNEWKRKNQNGKSSLVR
jgi:hypothetical protein